MEIFVSIYMCMEQKQMSSWQIANQLRAYCHLLYRTMDICKCAGARNDVTNVKAEERGRDCNRAWVRYETIVPNVKTP